MTPLLLAIAQDPSPRLSIQDAEEDESAHVQYITETYPVDQTIPDHFKLEPVRVEKGDRVAVIQELPNFTFRVKVLKDGQEGLLPAWALEEPQERLARINMEFNEAVSRVIHFGNIRQFSDVFNDFVFEKRVKATCPREEEAKSTKSSSHASHPHKCLHAHGSCPEQTPEARRAFVMQQRAQTVTTARQSASSFASGSSSSSEESVLRMPELALLSPSARVKKPRNKKVKIVQFRDAKQGELYRYVLPASFNKKESRYLRSFLGEDLEATAKAEEIKKQEEEDETIYFDSWTESWNAPGVVLDMYPLRSLDELKSRPPGSKSDRFLQRVGQGLSDLEFRSGRLGAKVLRGAVALHSRVIQP